MAVWCYYEKERRQPRKAVKDKRMVAVRQLQKMTKHFLPAHSHDSILLVFPWRHLTAIGWLFVSNPPVNALGNREHFFTIIVFFYQVLSPRHKEKLLNRKTNTWPLEVDKSEVPERQGLSITLSFLIKTGRPGYRNRNLKKSLQSLSLTIFKHK